MNLFSKYKITEQFNIFNYQNYRQKSLNTFQQEKLMIKYEKALFVHFIYCSSMRFSPKKFYFLWNTYFCKSPINEITPILGMRNVENIQRRLVHTRKQ